MGAYFDGSTNVKNIVLGNEEFGCVSVADVRWGGVNLAVIRWPRMRKRLRQVWVLLGDERRARTRMASEDKPGLAGEVPEDNFQYRAAARANRQLAQALRDQGVNEEAGIFAYQGQVLQRIVLRKRKQWLRWFGPLFLDVISGYGYKPLRSFITYLLVVLGFATLYFLMRDSVHPALSPLDAVIFSITSFHGRGFNRGETVTLHNPLTIAAAVEAIIGLLIEIVFIATFTQRFFAR